MVTSKRNFYIRNEARKILKQLYEVTLKERKVKSLKAEDFFPVDPKKIINSVINWKFEHRSFLGSDSNVIRITGFVDYDNKIIYIGDEKFGPRHENFTIAHEVGHAVLHQDSYNMPPVTRKWESRRLAVLTKTDEQRRMEREANIFASELLMPEEAVRNQFLKIFKENSLWIRSLRTQEIIEKCKQQGINVKSNLMDLKDYAVSLAEYKEEASSLSMMEFFNTTKTAMGNRMLELKLLLQ